MADEIAVVRVRGNIKISKGVKETLKMLNLYKKNFCVVVKDTPSFRGMINKVKDFVAWGEINEDTKKELKKRDEKKPFYRLKPPKKGYARKGTKLNWQNRGAIGNRGEKINDLIKRMI